MNRLLLTLAVTVGALAASNARAEPWTGPDKKLHAAAGAAIALAGTAWTKDAMTGFTAGCAVGVLKEVTDMRTGHVASVKDAAVTCLGAAVGAGTGFVITPGRVTWELKF